LASNLLRATALIFTVLFFSCSNPDDAKTEQAEEPISSLFRLTEAELQSMISELPPPVQSAILADPQQFLAGVRTLMTLPSELTVLTDKEHALGPDYAPARIIALDEYQGELSLSREGHRLAQIAVEPLRAMNRAATADGIVLLVSSAYRSYEYQRQVYFHWVSELGQEQADRVSARPGTSQHQIGTAVDFGCICPEFAGQPAGRWLAENAHRFGFSLSYPEGAEDVTGYSYEPWHFRYIGLEASELEQRFFGGMQQWMLEWLDATRPLLEAQRTS